MRWRLISSCLIIGLIILGGICALTYTGKVYDQMLAELETARINTGKPSGEALKSANELWEKNLSLICTLTGDAHVDAITQSFERAFIFWGREDATHEYLGAISDLISGLRHLRDYDRPSVRSIF